MAGTMRHELNTAELLKVITPNSQFRKKIESLSGEPISACFQCQKCSNGCPVTFAMDILPHRLMGSIHLGLTDEVLKSDTIWVCAACETCTTRCPNDIDIAHIFDTLRQESQRKGIKAAKEFVPIFHSSFLASVRRYGRVLELEMAVRYTLRSSGIKGIISQIGMGWGMLRKGKLRFLPDRLWANRQVGKIFGTSAKKVA